MFTIVLVTYLTSLSSCSYYRVLQSNIYYLTFREAWLHIVLDFCLYFFIIIPLLPGYSGWHWSGPRRQLSDVRWQYNSQTLWERNQGRLRWPMLRCFKTCKDSCCYFRGPVSKFMIRSTELGYANKFIEGCCVVSAQCVPVSSMFINLRFV